MGTPGGEPDHMSVVTDTTYLISDATSQQSLSTVGSISRQNGAPKLRVYVNLSTGHRVLVPIPAATATIQDLQFQALRRAAKLGVQAALGDTVMRTTGPDSAIIDGQDLVSDFIDFTANNTFALDVLNTAVRPPHHRRTLS
jgi:hypothetical protein